MINYILEGITNYFILFIGFIFLEGLIVFFYKKEKVSVSKEFLIGWQVLACFMVGIFSITGTANMSDVVKNGITLINPMEVNLIPFQGGVESLFGLTMNIVLFIPLGILIPLLWNDQTGLIKIMKIGFFLSLLVEISQLFNFRATDIDDLIMNTIGTAIGYAVYVLFLKRCKVCQIKNDDNQWFLKNSPIINVSVIFLFYFLIGKQIVFYIRMLEYGN